MYRFCGLLVRDRDIAHAHNVPTGCVGRQIERPFLGSGIRVPEEMDIVTDQEITDLAGRLGLGDEDTWVYLDYVTFAGRVAEFFGIVHKRSVEGKPILIDSRRAYDGDWEEQYLKLMAEFGLSEGDTRGFDPFERGFWGEEP